MQPSVQPENTGSTGVPSHEQRLGSNKKQRSRRIVLFLIIGVANLGFLTLLASQVLTPAHEGATGTVTSPLLGHLAPDFTLPMLGTPSSSSLHLARLKGKPLLLNFWASWCDPCKQEAPLLQTTWQHVQSQGVVFVGIDFGDTQSGALNFLHHYGITYSNVADTNGNVAISYGMRGVPETFFVDRRGVIVQKIMGTLNEQSLQQGLAAIIR
jgi:cytochrome c biogenesis protein CcmG/thiol:disulfide interchange protein DsbE